MAAPCVWSMISLRKFSCVKRIQNLSKIFYSTKKGTQHRENGKYKAAPERRSFKEIMEWRRGQASSSILVNYSNTSFKNLLIFCQSHGKVVYSECFHNQRKHAIIEYKDPIAIQSIMNHTDKSLKKKGKAVIKSRFLKFQAQPAEKSSSREGLLLNSVKNEFHLLNILSKAENVSQQLDMLMQEHELQEPEIRLRFLTCLLIEEAVQHILPSCTVYPFGSMVNSFGKRDCDVDMYLDRGTASGFIPVKSSKGKFELKYKTSAAQSERLATQSTLQALANYLEKQVPHCGSVMRIINARCPLVKFKHHGTDLFCDLTGDNKVAVKSSELLYVYGQLDPRVRPLVFFIRHWARMNGITQTRSGYWITNFPLTLLVIYFLQTRTPPILPTMNHLRDLADERVVINDVDCTFTGDLSKVSASKNVQSTEELLFEFYEFICHFNFTEYGVSIRTGSYFPSPSEQDVIHIENPFETDRNVCRNVSRRLLNMLKAAANRSIQVMDSSEFQKTHPDQPWGLRLLIHQANINRTLSLREKVDPVIQSLKNLLVLLQFHQVKYQNQVGNQVSLEQTGGTKYSNSHCLSPFSEEVYTI